MNKPTPTAVPADKTLTEQKTDFTAEGSPPPGKVSTVKPVATPTPEPAPAQPPPSPP